MNPTSNKGIDYSASSGANRDPKTGIRYGVVHQNEVLQTWADASDPYYGKASCPHCGMEFDSEEVDGECPKCKKSFDSEEMFRDDPVSFYVDDEEYSAECGDDGDIFISRSPYFTYAQFCSPCAPGACYLMNPLDKPDENNKCYCFGHDWFEGGKAPYPVFDVKTGEEVKP